MDLHITESLSASDEATILERLKAFNVATFGQSDRRDLAIELRDDNGTITGGLVGYTGRGWLYVSMLYVPESLRTQGLGTRMLAMAEDEARRRGCIGAYIDTMNPAALALYSRLGYATVGKLDALEGGHVITWLAKRF